MTKRLIFWCALVVAGLGFVYDEAQPLPRPAFDTAVDALASRASDPGPPALANETTERGSDRERSPGPDMGRTKRLAEIARPLESALPEFVLPDLLAPIGDPPTAVSLPSLGVTNAPVVGVGIAPTGELEVPGASAVGWYRFGVGVDAGKGSAVFAAHIAFNGVDGVFRNLADLRVGETITVDRHASQLSYEVIDVITFEKSALPIDDLFRETGVERLVLITCGGSFNPDLLSYDENVVAIAVPKPTGTT